MVFFPGCRIRHFPTYRESTNEGNMLHGGLLNGDPPPFWGQQDVKLAWPWILTETVAVRGKWSMHENPAQAEKVTLSENVGEESCRTVKGEVVYGHPESRWEGERVRQNPRPPHICLCVCCTHIGARGGGTPQTGGIITRQYKQKAEQKGWAEQKTKLFYCYRRVGGQCLYGTSRWSVCLHEFFRASDVMQWAFFGKQEDSFSLHAHP